MSKNTAWSKSSSFASDLLRPSPHQIKPKTPPPSKKDKENPPIRSKRYLALQVIHDGLAKTIQQPTKSKKDKTLEPCFCLSRVHALSPYVSLCVSCGLILCVYNLPFLPCPHCATPLASGSDRERLKERLAHEMERLIEEEERERIRSEMVRVQAEGAFPMLAPSAIVPHSAGPHHRNSPGLTPPGSRGASRPHTPPVPAPQTHKVLSLTANRRGGRSKAIITSHTTTIHPKNEGKDKENDEEDDVGRVSPPSKHIERVIVKEGGWGRRFQDLAGGGATYVPLKTVRPTANTAPITSSTSQTTQPGVSNSNNGQKKKRKGKAQGAGQGV